jgi:DNA-binding NarL/FixJ family response regulator
MAEKTRVCIVAGYASVRAGLHALLADVPEIEPVGAVEGVGDVLARLLPEWRPEVILLDTTGDSRGQNLADLIDLLQVTHRSVAISVIGEEAERELPCLTRAELLGWSYLLREADGPQIVQAVLAAASGLIVLDRTLAGDMAIGEARRTNAERKPIDRSDELPGEALTPREIEVLELMAEGLPNKIIATRLNISLHTAKFHVAQILGKLDAGSRTEAVTIGARRGYVML